MKNYIVMIGAVIPGMIALTSCTELPQQQITEAETAIENVKTIGAETYAPASYFAMQDSMKNAMSLINEQEGKFFKNYDEPIAKLETVKTMAVEVAATVETKKQEIKSNIETTFSEVKTSIEESKQLIADAPKGKDGATALLAMKGELEALEISLSESKALLEKEELQASLEKATVAKEKATQLNTELKDVMSKYKSARK